VELIDVKSTYNEYQYFTSLLKSTFKTAREFTPREIDLEFNKVLGTMPCSPQVGAIGELTNGQRHTEQVVVARRRKVSLDEASNHRDLSTVSSPINRGQSGQEPSRYRSHAILADVTSMLRDLYGLMQSYGPAWYTRRTDTRVRRTLAAAEAAMRISID